MNSYDCTLRQLRPGGLELTEHALSQCKINESSILLDVGCGKGESIHYMSNKFNCTVFGIEPEPSLFANAKAANPDVFIQRASAENIPFPEHYFDFVLMECVASLFESPEVSLIEIRRVLKSNGVLVITDIYSKVESFRGEGLLRNLYSRNQIDQILNKTGFEISIFEDHSRYLKQMMCQLILERGAKEFYQVIGIDRCRMKIFQPGYFLIIARSLEMKLL